LHYVAGQEKEQKYVEHAANHGILLHSRRSLSAVQHSCRVGAKGRTHMASEINFYSELLI